MKCLLDAWVLHESELHHWLLAQLKDPDEVEDKLQDVFIKALQQDSKFCAIENPRAWFFRVARNAVADKFRVKQEQIELPDTLVQEQITQDTIDKLSDCLPRALSELEKQDSEAIKQCDLQGMKQQQFAQQQNISLSAAKSRIQRARKRLRKQLESACQVRLDEAGKVCCFVPREPLKSL